MPESMSKVQMSLDVLAVEIQREVDAAEDDFQSAVAHAIRAGELLIEAKDQVRHGEWLPWLEANCPLGEREARRYMRLSRNRSRVTDLPSIREAVALLTEGHDDEDDTPQAPTREERIEAELIALCDSLDDQQAAMAEAIAVYGEEPTPAQVREVVSWYLWPADERKLREALRDGQVIVVNLKGHGNVIPWAHARGLLVKVDRTTVWGNPFLLDADGDREAVIAAYREHYLPHKSSLLAQLRDLDGKALACWCAPEPCHADVLADHVEAS